MKSTFVIPVRTVSGMNVREHWRGRQRRAKEHRGIARIMAGTAARNVKLPARVTMTRLSPRRLDEDNLAAALKHLKDGIADAFGVDDGDAQWTWVRDQEVSKETGVRVEIESTRS